MVTGGNTLIILDCYHLMVKNEGKNFPKIFRKKLKKRKIYENGGNGSNKWGIIGLTR
ncbi:hypothetical protein TISLANDTSLP1_16710 [Thermodesulfovibrio yellowstonii]|uniref:Uncharacterized protein n=1 Tax=Thermodesulfovibrio yellowstonii TaxID=28262 RepID=A0A9W6GES4_9BACT|nr:hypothetical protein TISLANDTSLP1_16710 [Thermodesulfovibrio islandicus]